MKASKMLFVRSISKLLVSLLVISSMPHHRALGRPTKSDVALANGWRNHSVPRKRNFLCSDQERIDQSSEKKVSAKYFASALFGSVDVRWSWYGVVMLRLGVRI